jgi:hypothetical protein
MVNFAAHTQERNKGYIGFPTGNSMQFTTVEVHADSAAKLTRPVVIVNQGEQEKKLVEYPQTYGTREHLYEYSKVFPANALLQLKLDRAPAQLHASKRTIVAVLFLFALIIWLFFEWNRQRKFVRTEIITLEPPKVEKRTLSDSEEGLPEPAVPVQDTRSLIFNIYGIYREYQRTRIRQVFIPMLIYLLLFVVAIFISGLSYGQTTNRMPSSVINKLTMEFDLEFNEPNKLSLGSKFDYFVCAPPSVDLESDSMHLFFHVSRKLSQVDYGQVLFNPEEMKCQWLNYQDSTGVCIKNRYSQILEEPSFNTLLNPSNDENKVTITGKPIDNGKFCFVNIPFSKWNVLHDVGSSDKFLGYRLHSFPYDDDTVDIIVSFDRLALLDRIRVNKKSNFTGELSSNIENFDVTENLDAFVLSGLKRAQIVEGMPIKLHLIVKRSLTSRFLWPFLVLVVIGVSIAWLFFPTSRWIKLAFILLGNGVLVGIYNIYLSSQYKGIPNFFNFNDVINYNDLIFGGGIFISGIISLVTKKQLKDDEE